MGWFTGLVLYSIIWWVVLFAILPLGLTDQPDADAATGWRGAPIRPQMGRKLLMTTMVAGLVWGLCAAVIASPMMDFRSGWLAIKN